MESVRQWFEMNLNLIFFVYGLSFLIMGTAILVQPKKGSQFKFAGILWLLVVYALLHMLSDSYNVLTFGEAKREAAGHTTHIVTYAAYLCLFEFGRRLIGLSGKTFFWWVLPVISIGVVSAGVLSGSSWTNLDVLIGYFIRFPAGIMAGLGFVWYYNSEKKKLEPLGVRKFFITAGVAFLFWTFFCGIIREKADFFPANLLNMESFVKTVYVPVYVFRSACAVIVTVSIVKILSIFEWESLRQLQEEMEKEYRAREKSRTVIETAMDGFFIAGPDGGFLDVNDAYCRKVGYTREELLRMRIQDVEALESPEDTARHMQRLIKTGLDRFESKHRTKSGGIIDVEVSVNFFQNDGGSFFVFLRDITGRKQTESLLRQSEYSYRTLAQNLPGIVFRLHCTERRYMQFLNEMLLPMTGYAENELKQDEFCPLSVFIDPEDIEKVESSVDQAVAYRRQYQVEYRFRHKNGSIRYFIERGKPIFNGKNELDFIDGIILDITDAKLAEKALRESEAKYRTIIENSNDVIWTLDRQGNFSFVNGKAEEVSGYKKADWLGKSFNPMIPQEDLPKTIQMFTQTLSGKLTSSEVRAYKADGTVFILAVNSAPVYEAGEITGTVSFGRDITDLKRAEDLLRRNEEYVRTVVEASLDAIVAVDERGRIMLFNFSAEKLFGYSAVEAIGKPASMLMVNDDAGTHQRNLERFMSEGIGQCAHIGRRLEQVFKRKDGTVFDAEIAMAGGRSDKYRVIVISIHDITDRKRAEYLLKESEVKYRTIFENTGAATIIIENDTVISLANTEFEKLSGFTRSQIEGRKSLLEFVSDEDKAIIEKYHNIRRTDAGLAPRNYEFRFTGKEGVVRDIFMTVAMIPGTQKSVASLTDITERRKLEIQFMQSQKMEVVGRLAGGIAHDFNNLLTVILGNTTLLMGQLKQDGNDYEMAKVIRETSERGAQLTKQLLAFSRRQVIEPVILNINDVTLKMSKMLTRVLGEDIECKFAFKPDLKHIKADVGQMGQVIMNLAVNAREAMPKGGRFSISTDNIALDEKYCDANTDIKPGEYVRVSITDTGIGMTGEVRKHLFEPFFTTKQSGTGLGLATVYGIVKQSGGSISVYSEIGKGTTFHIYLPVTDYDEAGDTTKVQKRKEETMPEGRETILIVEDELRLRELAVIILESLGYAVLSASGMEEAFSKAEACKVRIDLLLSDVILPGRSGVEVAQELKKKFRDIKVIFMSGYTDDRIDQSGFDVKKINFLQKPFTPSDLAHKVRDVLDRPER